jgi:uncharacterized membrane protein YqjE
MESSERSGRDDSVPDGFGSSMRGAAVGAIDYLEARLALLRFEAKEAGTDLVIRLVSFVVATGFCAIAYLALVAAVIGWISAAREWPWPAVTAGVALLHLLVAVILVAIARRRFSRSPFRDSLAELERDQEWLEDFREKS